MQRATLPLAWRYSTPAIVLHWLLAALIVFMVSLGWWMMTVEREPEGSRWFALRHAGVLRVVPTFWSRLSSPGRT